MQPVHETDFLIYLFVYLLIFLLQQKSSFIRSNSTLHVLRGRRTEQEKRGSMAMLPYLTATL